MSESSRHHPEHVAIIMDGNGRWARRQGLPRIEGHRRGINAAREIVRAAGESNLRYLTLFAFSVENWQRPESEVNALMDLLYHFLEEERHYLLENRVRLRCIGRIDELPGKVAERIHDLVEETAPFMERSLVIALNYGSRTEVVDAVRSYCTAVLDGGEDPEQCDWGRFSRHLYTGHDIPDPDLIIRTSGECRLSNFLLLQSAYSEIYLSPVLWPEFDRKEFHKAIECYRSRERRFGKTGEQVSPAVPATAQTL